MNKNQAEFAKANGISTKKEIDKIYLEIINIPALEGVCGIQREIRTLVAQRSLVTRRPSNDRWTDHKWKE